MEFKSLTSDLGQVFAIGIKITGIVYCGFLIYAIVEKIYGAIIIVAILMLILYLTYLRRLFYSKKVEFLEKQIRINGKKFNMEEVSEIKEGVLHLRHDKTKKIYFNHYYSHDRLNELRNILDGR